MNEAEFLQVYRKDIPHLRAWGDYINLLVVEGLSQKLKDSPIKDAFLRIQPIPRIKDERSILAKAFWRGKNYKDPYGDITDKIGIRYVVLLAEHIAVVSEVITKDGQLWNYSLDKDFERDKERFPLMFDYQSVHFVLKSKSTINHLGVTIPSETPCEIQIRTLLQHACCELTHDTIYKKEQPQNAKIYRSIAKSRALAEAADDIFSHVAESLASESQIMNNSLDELKKLYRNIRPPDYDEQSNVFILDSIGELAKDTNISDVRRFIFEDNPALKDVISEKAGRSFLYRQPVVLLLYYLVQYRREKLKDLWPLPASEIQPLFTDLGISLNHEG